MCTRYSFNLTEVDLGFLGLGTFSVDNPLQQIAPGRQVWMIRLDKKRRPEAVQAKWGLAPSWLDNFSKAQANARVETASQLPMFKEAWYKRRCLILADGYFQWHHSPDQRRQLWKINRQTQPFMLMAGLWERYQVDDTLSFESCAVLTMPATEQLSVLGERMPAVVNNDDALAWLEGGAFDVSRFSLPLMKNAFNCQSLVKR
ncbi:SOS response-associated peptidase family protein [uncultured Endozoicomonas sp.]|uniref:SOS response-associated peptidase n=1 Tax=uncultured Endozoicomonas sp. TaxID=432652 RepID=UPI0026141583|nr:SOS response-associated peptidase family protein [uncultured Endozoicomonas sp.]